MATLACKVDLRECINNYSKSQSRYLPALPPKPPQRATEYSRSVQDAPYSALCYIRSEADDDEIGPKKHEYPLVRNRVRRQVGLTNRWRLPEPVGADLLGSGQASRAIYSAYNSSLTRLMTAEGPQSQQPCGEDGEGLCDRRPATCPVVRKLIGRNECRQTMRTDLSVSRCSGKSNSLPSVKIQDFFQCLSRCYGSTKDPDMILDCFDMHWKLHLPFFNKSETLRELYEQKMATNGQTENQTEINQYATWKRSTKVDEDVRLHACWHAHPTCEDPATPHVCLTITDSQVTPLALTVVLGNMYRGEYQMSSNDDLAGVLLAAFYLRFIDLQQTCVQLMLQNITCETVSYYQTAAVKSNEMELMKRCEHWLEMKLIPELSSSIHLKHLSKRALLTVLKSPRLFCYNEYSIVKVLAYWIFLKLNPATQYIPPYPSVQTFFHSCSGDGSLLERDEGRNYADLFQTLHLSGINDSYEIYDVQIMNLLPQTWLVKLLSAHYNATHAGGDMSMMDTFMHSGIRNGFVVDQNATEKQKLVSVFGFTFDLKAVRNCECRGSYSFMIQRLQPRDPVLPVHDTERRAFSMRTERVLRYAIRVQSQPTAGSDVVVCDSGVQSHRFGLGVKTSVSKVQCWENLVPPLYVTFTMLLPPS